MKKKHLAALLILAAAAAVICLLLLRPFSRPAEVRMWIDGQEAELPLSPPETEDLRVFLTLDGKEIAVFPFGEPHTVRILQSSGDENTLRIGEAGVVMESANCEGQDCVHMEEVTRDNLETRVMFGMIICLPHHLAVEVK